MTAKDGRIGALAGAAILMVSIAAGLSSAQNTSAVQGPFNPGSGRGRGGPGGAGGPGGPGQGGPLLGALPMMGRLDLTDTQKDTLESIAQSHTEEWKGLLDHERTARQAVQSAISADSFDEAAIRQRSIELGNAEADVAVAQARVRQELLQVLTADQKARLKTFESRRPEGRGRRGR